MSLDNIIFEKRRQKIYKDVCEAKEQGSTSLTEIEEMSGHGIETIRKYCPDIDLPLGRGGPKGSRGYNYDVEEVARKISQSIKTEQILLQPLL